MFLPILSSRPKVMNVPGNTTEPKRVYGQIIALSLLKTHTVLTFTEDDIFAMSDEKLNKFLGMWGYIWDETDEGQRGWMVEILQ